jgi:hypothetical protein
MSMIDDDQSARAARLWWQPHPALPAIPVVSTWPDATGATSLRDPHPVATLLVALLGLVFTPFAIGAWIWAGRQLDAIERGELARDGRAVLVIAKLLGVIVTVAAITTAILIVAARS